MVTASDDTPPREQSPSARFDFIPQLRRLERDNQAVELGGTCF